MEKPARGSPEEEWIRWAATLSDKRLYEECRTSSDGGGALEQELAIRAAKPHWTTTWVFIVTCIGAMAAAIAAWQTWPSQNKSSQNELVTPPQTIRTSAPILAPTDAAKPPPSPRASSLVATPTREQSP